MSGVAAATFVIIYPSIYFLLETCRFSLTHTGIIYSWWSSYINISLKSKIDWSIYIGFSFSILLSIIYFPSHLLVVRYIFNIFKPWWRRSIVFDKRGIFSENLKTLTSSNYPRVQYFLQKLRTRFLLTNVYKRVGGIFWVLFRSWVTCKN